VPNGQSIHAPSAYIRHLPAIYQDDPFLAQFLKLFEELLSGDSIGLETTIARLATYFNPHDAEPEFLRWLAGWVALSLREDWHTREQRDLIGAIVSVYPVRGTRSGLEKSLRIYVGADVAISITELLTPFQVGESSTVGVTTLVGSGRPHYFKVHMNVPVPNPALLKQKTEIIKAILNLEKPAHTYYSLKIEVPSMRIAFNSRVGSDTLIGGMID